jgi:hypothetical protein
MIAPETTLSSGSTEPLPARYDPIDTKQYLTILQSLNRLWSDAATPSRRARMDALIEAIDEYEARTMRPGIAS